MRLGITRRAPGNNRTHFIDSRRIVRIGRAAEPQFAPVQSARYSRRGDGLRPAREPANRSTSAPGDRSNHRRSTHSITTIARRATVAGVALIHKTSTSQRDYLQAFPPVHDCLGERSRDGEVRAGPRAKVVDGRDQFEQ